MGASDPIFTTDEIEAAPEIAAQDALLQASAYLEQALHAGDVTAMFCALAACSTRMHWALADLALVGNEDQLDAAQGLTATIDSLVALGGLPDEVSLPTFQLQLLPLQSQILEVSVIPLQRWAGAEAQAINSGMLAFLGVLGAVVAVATGAAYIDYKQSHGGYPRGAPGVAKPVVSYRYPRRR